MIYDYPRDPAGLRWDDHYLMDDPIAAIVLSKRGATIPAIRSAADTDKRAQAPKRAHRGAGQEDCVMTNQCACGRPVSAGWTAGNNHDNQRCLICTTAVLMQTFKDPMTVKFQARVKRGKHGTHA
jgi:hypothetical protein